jgi:hypothetical protein
VRTRLRSRWLLVVGTALPLLAACDLSPRPVVADVRDGVVDTVFSLRVGQEMRPDAVLRIGFLGVRNDSRCPVDVVCVWAGNAEVEIGVSFGMGPTRPYVLNTTLDPRFVDLGAYRITLTGLKPDPVSTSPIPPDRYVATLRLQRLATAGG